MKTGCSTLKSDELAVRDRIAFIFPAFSDDISRRPFDGHPTFEIILNELFRENYHKTGILNLDFFQNPELPDGLTTQYLTYLYSVACAILMDPVKRYSRITAGYSMGIYATLFHAGSISIGQGLELIRQAYRSISENIEEYRWGMGFIIGLSLNDLQEIISSNGLSVEITNRNAELAFSVSGKQSELDLLLDSAREEGAMSARRLTTSLPYHHSTLRHSSEKFLDSLQNFEFRDPEIPVVSVIDQQRITTASQVKEELFKNLHHPLNWKKTQKSLVEAGITTFVECGIPGGLARNSRFIDESHHFLPIHRFSDHVRSLLDQP
jgi:[acyl-carrier-protein] S-malonyltransferase